MNEERLDANELLANGFANEPLYGLTKDIGDLTIFVGNFPRNELCVSLRFRRVNATIITNATCNADIEQLERLLGNPFVDDDYEEEIYADDLPEES